MSLPVGDLSALQPEHTPVPALPDDPLALRRRRALVVDDEEPLLRLQLMFLKRIDVVASGVTSGADAIRYLQEHEVDLIISDVRMSGAIDGFQLLDWVSRHQPERLKRFLLTSGDLTGAASHESVLAAQVAYLQKPFTFNEYRRIALTTLES
jgi:DNA-binding NtrC family response regulator